MYSSCHARLYSHGKSRNLLVVVDMVKKLPIVSANFLGFVFFPAK
jgi:hypothetical protein